MSVARRRLLLGGGRGGWRDDFDGIALSPRWDVLRGTPNVAGGVLRADALGSDGHNVVTNGEFTNNIDSWSQANATPTWCNSAVDPGVTSPGADAGIVRIERTGNIARLVQTIEGQIIGVTWLISLYMYSPSANVSERDAGWQIDSPLGTSLAGSYTGNQISAEDVWEGVSKATSVVNASSNLIMRLNMMYSGTSGDLAYYDSVSITRRSLLALARAAPHLRLRANVTAPASGVCPLHIVFRALDGLTYSMVRLHPATEGNDTHIIERVVGIETTRASADVDFAASTAYDIGIDAFGSNVVVSVNGVARTSYNAAIGQTYPYVGLELLDSAAAKWTVNSFSVEW